MGRESFESPMTDRSRTNPFPGFDPYLERWWGSVHATLLVYVQDDLQPRLPDGLFARRGRTNF